MADSGLTRFISRGIRFATTKASTTYVGVITAADPTTSFSLTLPSNLPASTQTLAVSATGVMTYLAAGGGGSVTSIGVSTPSDFVVSGSPVTTSGTISLSRASQSANLFMASPDSAVGIPVYRSMVTNDVPALPTTKITGFDTQVRTSRLDQLAVPTATVSLNAQTLSGLATPVNPQDAANKLYVDSVASSVSNKGSAKASATTNINLAAPGTTIDSFTMSVGDLFLAPVQTVQADNGLYLYNGSATAATRATQADTSAEVKSGMFVFIQSGTLNGSNGFTLVTADPIVLGTTALSFVQTSGAGQILAGAGLVKTGNLVDVVGTASRITVAADNIDISASYIGQTSLTTLGTISAGVWQATGIAISRGGTGGTDPSSARIALGCTTAYRQSFTNAALTSGNLVITHNIGQQYVTVKVYDDTNKLIVADDVTCSSPIASVIDLTSFGTLTGTWQIVIIG